jgi:hypothetical protein
LPNASAIAIHLCKKGFRAIRTYHPTFSTNLRRLDRVCVDMSILVTPPTPRQTQCSDSRLKMHLRLLTIDGYICDSTQESISRERDYIKSGRKFRNRRRIARGKMFRAERMEAVQSQKDD